MMRSRHTSAKTTATQLRIDEPTCTVLTTPAGQLVSTLRDARPFLRRLMRPSFTKVVCRASRPTLLFPVVTRYGKTNARRTYFGLGKHTLNPASNV
jgi:hypothetical protein